MDFRRARNEEQIANRQTEIIDACYSLCLNSSYDDITFGKISEITSISRPSIYNYYLTREEILLDVLEREYFRWFKKFKDNCTENTRVNKSDFCDLLVNSFKDFVVFLKLLSIQYSVIEKNCSFEKLTQFKMSTQEILNFLESMVSKTFPRLDSNLRNTSILMLFSFIGSIYEMCNPNEIQVKAMKVANREYNMPVFEDLSRKYIETLFSNS